MPSTGQCGDCPHLRIRLTSDPTERIRKIQKISLLLRSVWRFSRVKGGWPDAKIVGVEANTGLDVKATLAARLPEFTRAKTRWRSKAAPSARKRARSSFSSPPTLGHGDPCPSDTFHDDLHHDGVERTEKLPLKCLDELLAGCDGPMLLQADVPVAEREFSKVPVPARRCIRDRHQSPNKQAYDGTAGLDDISRFLPRSVSATRPPRATEFEKTGRIRQADSVCVRA